MRSRRAEALGPMLHLVPPPTARRRSAAPGGFPWASAALMAAVAAAFLIPGAAGALELDRQAVRHGEWWRLFTGHLVHFGLDHFVWDALVFAALAAICERRGRARCLVTLAAAAPAISLGVLLFLPRLAIYRGLSGLDSALAGLLAADVAWEALRERDWPWAAAAGTFILGFLGKTVFETATGATLFVDSVAAGFGAVPLAHAVGLLAGATMLLSWRACMAGSTAICRRTAAPVRRRCPSGA
jgi:rhomboid family GlyGly-CTERM serine protease